MEFLYIVDSSMLENGRYIKNTMKVVRFLKRLILLMIKENGQGKIYYEDGKILRIVNLKNGKENW